MKIRRYVAKDIRSALTQIKEELGADAVIMSNKKIAEGVELMAAVDYNKSIAPQKATEQLAQQPQQQAQNTGRINITEDSTDIDLPSAESVNNTAPADSLSALLNRQAKRATTADHQVNSQPQAEQSQLDIEQQLKDFTDRLAQSTTTASEQNTETHLATEPLAANTSSTTNTEHQTQHSSSLPENNTFAENNTLPENNAADITTMQKEMASIRQLLEHQLSGLMWQDMARKDPMRAVLVNRLVNLGLNEQMANQIAGYVPANSQEDDAWLQAKKIVAQQLNTTNNDIIQRGGVVSLVGPTGVGKTTTIAKLAAKFAQIHGADQVVLISTDSYRIAGFEQLCTYGRIIGCQVKMAKDTAELDGLLQQFSQKKLILIDTAGMGQRDMRLTEQLTTLVNNSRVNIRNYLVLSANTQQRVMQENVERFKRIPLSGCIYTKLDESLSVGEIISTSLQNGLAIAYLTDGQRVPEDIKIANTEKLVTLADKMAVKYHADHSAWQNQPMAMAV